MNYYEHHIGDFRSGTVNMTRQERWLYRDLIEVYYDTEGPLTADVEKLCKDIGVRSDEEKAIVLELLAYKFKLTERGYEHERCESVIAAYRGKAETARENGKKGGRPPKNKNPEKPSGFISETEVNPYQTGLKANQEPVTNNQKPEVKPIRATRFDAQAHLVSLGVETQIAKDWLATRKRKKLESTLTAMEQTQAEVAKAGVSLNDALRECCARGWGGFKASWLDEQPSGRINGHSNDNPFA